jgi:hypothetical protein
MSILLEALVGELHIRGGVRQSASRSTASFVAPRRAARGRASDRLFVLVDLRGPDALPYQDLMDRIEAAYWRTPGSVTAALRAALVIANDWLMDRNVQREVADRVRAGVCCAVLRDTEVVIAQAGPAAAYVAHHGQVERFPARETATPAMGASRGVEVRFSHTAFSPGDVLLLCDSATAERITDKAIAEAIVYTGVETALQSLEKLTGANDLIAMVVEGAAERKTKAALAAALQGPPPDRPIVPTTSEPQTQAPAAQVEELPPPVPVMRPPTAEARVEADKALWEQRMEERAVGLNRGSRAGGAEPIQAPGPQITAPQPMEAEAVEATEPVTLAQRIGGLAGRLRPAPRAETEEAQAAAETFSWRRRLAERVAELNLGERVRSIGGSLRAGSIVAARGVATILQRTLPEGAVTQQPGKTAETVLITFAVVIPLVVFILVAASYKQHSTLERFQSLLSSARNEAAQAATLQDPTARRARWASSLEQARSALAVFPDDAVALAARDEAQRALDQIDNVVRQSPTLLWDFKSPGPHRLAVQSVNLFVLDRGANRVFQLTLNESGDGVTDAGAGEPPTRAYKSQAVNDRQVGDLIDLVWMPIGGTRTRSSLLILDSGGLLDYDLAWNLRAVPLGQGAAPAGARAIAAFGGNLYVLDAAANQIWRYRPQGDGYGGTAESYFETPPGDLSTALDVAIDGSVYLLLADGRIRKFFGGAEQNLAIAGLSEPLTRPAALAVDAETRQGALYVADAGRVVQLKPDGAFIRQFRAAGDAFDALEDLVVDEGEGRMFVMSGGRLYVTHLPALP